MWSKTDLENLQDNHAKHLPKVDIALISKTTCETHLQLELNAVVTNFFEPEKNF